MNTELIAEKYHVSRAWVHRLQRRRREIGSIQPRPSNALADAGAGRRTWPGSRR